MASTKVTITTSKQLREQIEHARLVLQDHEGKLASLKAEAEQAAVESILTGKAEKPSHYLAKTAEMQSLVTDWKAKLTALEAALRIIETEEKQAAEAAEGQQIADLTARFRSAVKVLIGAIEAGDPLAVQQAEDAVNKVRLQFPEKRRPAEICVPQAATYQQEVAAAFLERLCELGLADLIPPSHIARVRYEHGQAHAKRMRERLERQQQRIRSIADSSIVPDESTSTIPYQPKTKSDLVWYQ